MSVSISRGRRLENYDDIVDQVRSGDLILTVRYDPDPEDPRCWSNLGTMICFHRRYILGDKHEYPTPRHFLEALAREINEEGIYKLLKERAERIYELDYDEEKRKWIIREYGDSIEEYDTKEEAEERLRELREYYQEDYDGLDDEDLLDIISEKAVIMPLYLYDHSGLAMSTSDSYYPFNDPWDAGQVGWIYAPYERIEKEFGEVNSETIRRAEEILRAEVEVYNQYLSGSVYGFTLDKMVVLDKNLCKGCDRDIKECFGCYNLHGLEHIDSCYGFYGVTRKEVIKQMKSAVAPEYQFIFDKI